MIRPNFKIPKVAAASLLFGVGCGGSDDTPAEKVAGAFCSAAAACDPDFSMDYASEAECKTAFAADLQSYIDYYTALYGAACGNAVLDLYECYVDSIDVATCSVDYYGCNAEYAAYYSNCYGSLP